MKSLKLYFKVRREDIGYLSFIIESYSGLAVVRTIDSREALIEILIAPQNGDLFEDLIWNLRTKEKLKLIPVAIDKNVINNKQIKSEIGV